MSTYSNLPGVNLELLDGNLRIDDPVAQDSLLIIGLAERGTTGFQYSATDSNKAANAFGASSPIIKRMEQGRVGGAKNVVLYRIGGKAARIDGIFGEGSYIETAEETVTAGSKFKLYIGERPAKDGKACLIIFQDDKIVYSNVPGSEVNRNLFIIEGFDVNTKVTVGAPTEPVVMEQVILAPEKKELHQDAASGTEFVLPSTRQAYTVTVNKVTVGGQVVSSGNYSVQNADTDAKKLVFVSGEPTAQSLDVEYTVTGVRSEDVSFAGTGNGVTQVFDMPKTTATDKVFLTSVKVNGEDKLSDASVIVGGAGLQVQFSATTPEDGHVVVVDFVVYKEGTNPPGTYTAGEDNINCSWKKYFELLHSALSDLDVINSFSVVTDRAIVDAPNIATGSVEKDRLDYISVEEINGSFKYEWSETKVLYKMGPTTTPDASKADVNGNGQPIVAKQFHEANFAHLLATFAHNVSENEKFCLVTIGTSTPKALTKYEIAKWIGTSPVYDITGQLVENGTGLLGLRNMVERSEARQGFYKTTSGFVDGSVEFDSNGAPIDIGKYLSVVPAIVNTGVSAALGTDGRNTNAAAVYAGLLTTINPGDSTTNVVVPRISLPFDIKKTKLDELSGAGYVMFQEKTNGVTLVSGELATNINSDYDYVSTAIIVADVIESIRETVDPYIGRGMNEATTAALNTAIESTMQAKVTQGSVVKYGFSVISNGVVNGKGSLSVPVTIVPAFELREVNVSMKLALDV